MQYDEESRGEGEDREMNEEYVRVKKDKQKKRKEKKGRNYKKYIGTLDSWQMDREREHECGNREAIFVRDGS